MTPIGLFYGTDTGFTEIVVKLFIEEFDLVVPDLLTLHDNYEFTHSEGVKDGRFLGQPDHGLVEANPLPRPLKTSAKISYSGEPVKR